MCEISYTVVRNSCILSLEILLNAYRSVGYALIHIMETQFYDCLVTFYLYNFLRR